MAVSQWIALILSFVAAIQGVVDGYSVDIGVNYGLLGDDLPKPKEVIKLFKGYGIGKIRLFNPDPKVLWALRGQEIDVTLGVPNEDLTALAESQGAVNNWFDNNVEPYLKDIVINYITVGNEVIPGPLGNYVWQVMQYLQNVLDDRNYAGIKITTVIPGTALKTSFPPSAGEFNGQSSGVMASICGFLLFRGSPLMINVYPYFAYAANPTKAPLDYALFNSTKPVVQDGNLSYYNLFDATVDAFISAMERVGGAGVEVAVSESGWPSAGNGIFTSPELAGTYNRNFLKHVTSNKGTPKRPGHYIEGFIFAMFNENQKPAGVEQNFGLFYPSMRPVYTVF